MGLVKAWWTAVQAPAPTATSPLATASELGSNSGEAIGQVVSGAHAPTGCLPYALPSTDRGRGLPFGHGLTYTDFTLRDIAIEYAADAILVSGDLTNQGEREGSAMVQLYLQREGGDCPMTRPALRDYARIHLDPGQRRRVSFAVGSAEMGYFAVDGSFVVEAGRYDISLGLDAAGARGHLVAVSEGLADAIRSSGQPQGPSRALPAR